MIQDHNEVPLVVHSKVTTPISDMTFLRRALLFSELAMISYNDQAEASAAAALAGFPDATFYDRDGSQAYRFRNDHDCVIACRGTEPNEWNDVKADADARSVLAETTGKVHGGFKQEVDDLWPMLETALTENKQPLWFCGHSLGAAMATICAGRCFLSHINSRPEELYSYGSPRVGNKAYINYVKLAHYRFVNNNDIVTRVPPAWLGFRHSGDEIYINHSGELKNYGLLLKRRDRWQGFLGGLRNRQIDHFSDHSIHRYIASILQAVKKEDTLVGSGGHPASSDQFCS